MKKPIFTIIVAVSENQVIGKDNNLIWDLKRDLSRFKNLTSGHHIIMGRKTFESFQKPLPNRVHIVITRQKNYPAPSGVIVVNSVKEAIECVVDDDQPFIIGGGEIYEQALKYASVIELTLVHSTFVGDTFFPKIDHEKWIEVNREDIFKDENHNYDFSFITYKKINL
ncbi:MAG: diacylglycerol kinase [Flavobacteriales bacterium]|nr:diacylglycerol kinase [Flavobacteriales bacterium]|tara:strand:- start:297 stop:800 length:504 start_codon:yes stop_codon:yes gene_type:complete